ncbi:hypothetical protein HG537_0G04810 [Torulaspora globosa]|uniref:Phosphoinositide phospholipase C n=1 Tax=Torulaspora globosa TaxID=48254 RepID=A0A7H9I066_9SACH|nr:hypothetical protein HG537_0G04810 [Torulaspora sp. CBS 2947]
MVLVGNSSRSCLGDFDKGNHEETDSKRNLQLSTFRQSSSASVTRNIKAIFKRPGFINSSRESSIADHAGPMTYAHSYNDAVSYFISMNAEPSLKDSLACMRNGLCLRRISRRKQVIYIFKLENDETITWKDGAKRLELDSIKDIRTGNMASNYREEYGVSSKVSDFWITIIYNVSNKLKALHVVAENEHDFSLFFNCICGLVKSRRELMESISVPDNEKFANFHWHRTVSERKEDETKDTLTFEDVKRLCNKFHIYCSSNHLLKFFIIADVNHNGLLNFQEFQTFVGLLKERPEVRKIWNKFTKGSRTMDFEMFYRFLTDVQKENISREKAFQIFVQFRKPKHSLLYEEDFVKFLGGQPYVRGIEEDYTKPLNHYFIASSHNTYLLGKQVGETPSVEGYVQVLQQGCRCIEIDIWDDDMGPVVCHGFLTAAIPLINVVEIIKKYAFITSPFPLVISLEINCNKENQIIANSIFQNCFGSLLYYPSESVTALPSPMELRHKIILKGKKTMITLPFGNGGSLSNTESTSSSCSSSLDSEIESTSKGKDNQSSSSIQRMKRIKKKNVVVTRELLATCGLHGLKFRNFSLPDSKTPAHCFSFDEKAFDSMQKDKTLELSIDKHNRRFLMRVYPHALRYKSSNFNPIKFWKLGVQMVAANWQTNDLGQQINLAMFQLYNRKHGVLHSGYVLKPPRLLPTVSKALSIPQIYKQLHTDPIKLKLKILSAQLLPKPTEIKNSKEASFAPYVTVELISDEELSTPLTVKRGTKYSNTIACTENCKENGFNPVWNMTIHATFKSLDFAFVKFTVKTGEFQLATSCFRLQLLRSGYRSIPLYNSEGELYIFSTLFIYTRLD